MGKIRLGVQGVPCRDDNLIVLLRDDVIFQKNAFRRNDSLAVYLRYVHGWLLFICFSPSYSTANHPSMHPRETFPIRK